MTTKPDYYTNICASTNTRHYTNIGYVLLTVISKLPPGVFAGGAAARRTLVRVDGRALHFLLHFVILFWFVEFLIGVYRPWEESLRLSPEVSHGMHRKSCLEIPWEPRYGYFNFWSHLAFALLASPSLARRSLAHTLARRLARSLAPPRFPSRSLARSLARLSLARPRPARQRPLGALRKCFPPMVSLSVKDSARF